MSISIQQYLFSLPLILYHLLLSLLFCFSLVSLTKDKLVYTWGNLIADECHVEVFDEAMAQYEYKGVKLNYRHKKIVSGMCVVQQQITESRNRKKSLKRYLYLLLDSSYSTFCLNFKKSRSLLRLDNYIRLEILKQSVLSGPSKLGFKNFSLFFADKKSASTLVSIQSCHVILPTCCLANPRRAVTINHNCISVLKNKSDYEYIYMRFSILTMSHFFQQRPFQTYMPRGCLIAVLRIRCSKCTCQAT